MIGYWSLTSVYFGNHVSFVSTMKQKRIMSNYKSLNRSVSGMKSILVPSLNWKSKTNRNWVENKWKERKKKTKTSGRPNGKKTETEVIETKWDMVTRTREKKDKKKR